MKRLIVTLLALAALGTACADVTTDALTVNGETIDRGDLLELITDFEDVDSLPTDGTVTCSARDTAMVILLQNLLAADALEAFGGAVTEPDLADAGVQADQLIELGEFDEPARPYVVEALSLRNALVRVAADGADAALATAVIEADVEIDPRFGTWTDGLGFTRASPCL